VWAVTSKRVASDTVSFIHKALLIDSAVHIGGVKTYNGSEPSVNHGFVGVCVEDAQEGRIKSRS
jgi:hypothetical protein